MTAAAYAESAPVVAALEEQGAEHRYAADAQRHLAPPKGSQQMAELDGRFDSSFGGSAAQMTDALRLALLEEGTFLDTKIVNPATGKKTVNQKPIMLHPAGDSPGALRTPDSQAGNPTPWISRVLRLLSGPHARAAVSAGSAGRGCRADGFDYKGDELVHEVALFPGSWPKLEPFRLRLSEGPIGLAFTNGVLEATLAQAEVVYGHLSSVSWTIASSTSRLWQWIPELQRTAALKQVVHEGLRTGCSTPSGGSTSATPSSSRSRCRT